MKPALPPKPFDILEAVELTEPPCGNPDCRNDEVCRFAMSRRGLVVRMRRWRGGHRCLVQWGDHPLDVTWASARTLKKSKLKLPDPRYEPPKHPDPGIDPIINAIVHGIIAGGHFPGTGAPPPMSN